MICNMYGRTRWKGPKYLGTETRHSVKYKYYYYFLYVIVNLTGTILARNWRLPNLAVCIVLQLWWELRQWWWRPSEWTTSTAYKFTFDIAINYKPMALKLINSLQILANPQMAADERFVSNVFLYIGFAFVLWLLLFWAAHGECAQETARNRQILPIQQICKENNSLRVTVIKFLSFV